jgi:hypothetical protein
MMGRQINGHTKVHSTGALFSLLLGGLVFLSCDLMLPIEIDFDTDTFNRERAAWEEQGIVDYTALEGAGIGVLVYITVRDNAIIEDDLLEAKWRSSLKTISEIYAYVDQIYEEALERIEADKGKKGGLRGIEIKVTYNKEFHYPSYVRIKHSYYENGVIRGNLGNTFCLYEFTPLAPAE